MTSRGLRSSQRPGVQPRPIRSLQTAPRRVCPLEQIIIQEFRHSRGVQHGKRTRHAAMAVFVPYKKPDEAPFCYGAGAGSSLVGTNFTRSGFCHSHCEAELLILQTSPRVVSFLPRVGVGMATWPTQKHTAMRSCSARRLASLCDGCKAGGQCSKMAAAPASSSRKSHKSLHRD